MKFKNIKTIFFDLDMTLWDHNKSQTESIRKLCKKFDLDFPRTDIIYKQVNDEFWQIFIKGQIDLEDMRVERFEETLKRLGKVNYDCANISKEYLKFYSETIYLIEDAEELLKNLYPYFKLGILTNGFNDTQNQKLNSSSIIKYITYNISVSETNVFKPAFEFFDYAMKLSGDKPKEIVCVGDNFEADVIGAKNAGWHVVWFNSENKPNPSPDIEPDATISRLMELLGLLSIPKANKVWDQPQ